jgi:hypothetical protein
MRDKLTIRCVVSRKNNTFYSDVKLRLIAARHDINFKVQTHLKDKKFQI